MACRARVRWCIACWDTKLLLLEVDRHRRCVYNKTQFRADTCTRVPAGSVQRSLTAAHT